MAAVASSSVDGSASASVCAKDEIEKGAKNKTHSARRMNLFVLV
jgi:hypothetical protein